MSDSRSQRPPEGATHLPYARGLDEVAPASGWAGWVFFAALMMVLAGVLQSLAGVMALFSDDYYAVTKDGLLLPMSYSAWGWVHLILGVVVVGAGLALMRGATWGRVVAVVLCMMSVVVHIGFLAASPLWTLVMIALNILVIFAITTHGADLKDNQRNI